MIADLTPAPRRYSPLEDLQGLLIASAQAALGIHLLRAAGLFSGGTAGSALILAHLTGANFSWLFLALNLPFFGFAYWALGARFCAKSVATVVMVSAFAAGLEPLMQLSQIHPAIAAAMFGISTGVGLLGLFRHSGSLGGISIVALVLQRRFGFKAAWTQVIHDGLLFLVALAVLPGPAVGWSILGAVILNLVIFFNHRRDWYVVT